MRAVSHSVPMARRRAKIRPRDWRTRQGCATVWLASHPPSDMSIPALRFEQLTKRYRHASVLQGVDLEVARGALFGLVGVNGAGKTSLLHCLLDFCSVDDGAITILGQPHGRPPARAPLAFLPERFTPPYYLTGADFLEYMLTLQNLPYQAAAVA